MVQHEWKEVFSPYIENVMLKQIDRNSRMLQKSLKMNFERFEGMYDYGLNMATDSESYKKEIDGIKQFVVSRKKTLDQLWREDTEICTVRFEGIIDKNRCIAVGKGDVIQAIPGTGESSTKKYFWRDQETGERIEAGMVVNHDIVAMAVCE